MSRAFWARLRKILSCQVLLWILYIWDLMRSKCRLRHKKGHGSGKSSLVLLMNSICMLGVLCWDGESASDSYDKRMRGGTGIRYWSPLEQHFEEKRKNSGSKCFRTRALKHVWFPIWYWQKSHTKLPIWWVQADFYLKYALTAWLVLILVAELESKNVTFTKAAVPFMKQRKHLVAKLLF